MHTMKKPILRLLAFFSVVFPVLVTFCSLLSGICHAQSQFQLAIGGLDRDYAYSIIRTTDGGYAVAGLTRSFGAGDYDFYIVKLDMGGTFQWSKSIGGANAELQPSIVQTTDGGYAIAGQTRSFGASPWDIYIVKLDGSGTFQWNRTVRGGGALSAFSIIQTTDGGYMLVGEGDCYFVKLDPNGALQWTRLSFGTAYSAIQATDGGYAVVGYTSASGAGNDDMYIVKVDTGGTPQWNKTVGGTGNEHAYSIVQTTDGGYAVAGGTDSFGAGGIDMYIVKLDGSGTLQWTRTVGGTGNDVANSIIQTTDGGYAVAGYTLFFGAPDMYIVKLDGNGTLQWSRAVGGTGGDFANSIIQTTDGGYAVAGHTDSFGAGMFDMYIVKLDASGNTCGNSSSPSSISGTGGTTTSPTPTVITPTPTVTNPTPTTSTGGTVTAICNPVGIQPILNEIPDSYELDQNFPNPFNPATTISFSLPSKSFVSLKVFDALGREVSVLVSEELSAGTYTQHWDAAGFASGVYFYCLSAGSFVETKKLVLLR